MKKKISFCILLFVIVCIVAICYCMHDGTYIYDYEYKKVRDSKQLSMMLEQNVGKGDYQNTVLSEWPSDGYTFNSSLSRCEKGGEVSWDENTKQVIMISSSSDKCYVYFDKNIVLNLSNYTFNWDEINSASSYDIYSDNKLLTSTSDNTAEIYSYYTSIDTYNIRVVAKDEDGNQINQSNEVAYKITGKAPSLTLPYEVSITKTNCDDIPVNYNISLLSCLDGKDIVYNYTGFDIGNEDERSSTIYNNNYSLKIVDVLKFLDNNNIIYFKENGSFGRGVYSNYFINIDNSIETLLNELSYSFEVYPLEGLNYTNKINISYLNNELTFSKSSSAHIFLAFQIIEPGKASSDWVVLPSYICCLSENTEIYVYDRRKKRFRKKKIANIDYDDEILCWDFDTGNFAVSKPIWIMKENQTYKYNELVFSDGSVLETIEQHRIYNKELGKFTYPMSDDTPIGTTTFNAQGENVTLISKKVVERPIKYYNIITENHINLFANNILTSCRLNNMYDIKDMKFIKDKELNNYDFSKYDSNLVKGLRLREQHIDEKELIKYVDNLLKIKDSKSLH